MQLRSLAASLLLVSGPLVFNASAQSLAGEWDATVKANGVDVPCRFKITGDGPNLQGTFFNGEELYPSTSATFVNGGLVMNFDYTSGKLEATWKDGRLQGAHFTSNARHLWLQRRAAHSCSAAFGRRAHDRWRLGNRQ